MSEGRKRTENTAKWQLDGSGPEAYERYLVPTMFAPWAERLLDRVDLRASDRVLDVASGTGIVARRAGLRVGEEGTVVGIDVNESMLEVARGAASGDLPAVEWKQGNATDLRFPDEAFDAVFCQQGLQFVEEPATACREMYRVVAPDGQVAISVWRPLEFNPAYATLADALADHVGEQAAAMMRSPFPDWDETTLRRFLREAGFREAVVTIGIGSMRYPSIEEFVRREAASSPLAEPLAATETAVREKLILRVGESLQSYTDDDGVVFPMETYVAIARR